MKTLKLSFNTLDRRSHISKEIYSNFSEHLGRCIYDGIYVGEDSGIPNVEGYRRDVLDAFRELEVPVLRWPGGCFADEYHWRDGIGRRPERAKMINTNWGGLVEDNSFGTHEFMRFCELAGCEPYISGNVGSGTVEELSKWVEYMTFDGSSPMSELRRSNGQDKPWRLKYLGIGNENWGGGGNMRPEFYADTYRQFATFCKNYGGNQLFKIACGPNDDDYNWTETVMRNIPHWMVQGLSLHYYTVPSGDWNHKGSAVDFTDEEYYLTIKKTMKMETLVQRHGAIMDRYDPEHKVGLVVDEWGTWFDVEEGTNPGFLYQLNTMRDAMVAAVNLNIFNEHSDRVVMANIAQAVNVLQAILLTKGKITVKTPTYYVFKLYKKHRDATLIYSHIENEMIYDGLPCMTQSASVGDDGKVFITVSNCSLDKEFEIEMSDCFGSVEEADGDLISAKAHEMNRFGEEEKVFIKPLAVRVDGGRAKLILPPCSIAAVTLSVR